MPPVKGSIMTHTILKDVLISQGAIERYFEGCVPVNLWRGLNIKRNDELFSLVEEEFLQKGRPRPADIDIKPIGGTKWVLVRKAPRGISTFDCCGIPKGNDWRYYRIPAGTLLPPGLVVVRDNFNETFQATHYTIAPDRDMPLELFKLLLRKFAAFAVKESA
jgi:hypothetical protein